MTALASLCIEKGVLDAKELEARTSGFPISRPSAPGRSNAADQERLQPGDIVRVLTGISGCQDISAAKPASLSAKARAIRSPMRTLTV
jgi:hypothetical protein